MNESERWEEARRAAFATMTSELHAKDQARVEVEKFAATRDEALDIVAVMAQMAVGILVAGMRSREGAAEYLRAAALAFEEDAASSDS